ncbi:hypothetical protein Rahaq2_1829 [Rahnella aquatilis CIP 78.65 = ATCC 33071]|uniref:Uncharacterized protein n=1 Tax=Rahnella aquatilis (strain ATCC 33071 / DSM 4594 / JCM 1683 / NBRC 105701 / NCIMB 13365 / CIP 78.65) TaxID=745277 RepID=H2IUQ4_RAHAC|nr:hypothetical protein Rahaq2_1829 [Rahnella aquatilis CIP 78.65 = ATCC 33071]
MSMVSLNQITETILIEELSDWEFKSILQFQFREIPDAFGCNWLNLHTIGFKEYPLQC